MISVPRSDLDKLDPNEVASISILKDASATAVFGVRGLKWGYLGYYDTEMKVNLN